MTRRPLVAGNWKMNGLAASRAELETLKGRMTGDGVDVLLCPPATLIAGFAEAAAGSAVRIGGQDCHAAASGAHTGDIAAEMLADAGAVAVILGHSERRADHGE
ncbi:MAG: triose-phosphate isomerase, partial [Pseudomonadota bacterium]